MTERRLRFGSVARDYERFRLGYPDDLVDRVLAYAATPVRTAVEIGAGTGKATRLFAARGVRVTATDPDAAMLAELRRHVPPSVTTVQAGLEGLDLPGRHDLVYAAASLHWTEPAGRWERVAALLEPGGVFASFGGPWGLSDPDLAERVRVARVPFLPDDEVPSPDGTPEDADLRWPGTELADSPLFTDVRQSTIERRSRIVVEDYLGHLGTVSAYLELPGGTLRELLDAIRAVLPDRVDIDADLTLHLARSVR